MKKSNLILFLSSIFSLFLIKSVSAASFNFDSVGEGVADVFRAVFGPMFGSGFDEFFFYKVLLFVIMVLVIRVVLVTFPPFEDKKGIVGIIAIAVSLISIRYLGELDLMRSILIPYGTLAVTLLTLIPFLIFFFFVHKSIDSAPGRKIAWIFYLIVLFGIWSNMKDRLNDIGNYIYAAVFILALLLIFFDRDVRRYFGMRATYSVALHAINLHLGELHTAYRNAMNIPGKQGEDERKRLMKEIKRLEEEKSRLS